MTNLRYHPGIYFEIPRQSQPEYPVHSPLAIVSLPVPRKVLNRMILPTASQYKHMTYQLLYIHSSTS